MFIALWYTAQLITELVLCRFTTVNANCIIIPDLSKWIHIWTTLMVPQDSYTVHGSGQVVVQSTILKYNLAAQSQSQSRPRVFTAKTINRTTSHEYQRNNTKLVSEHKHRCNINNSTNLNTNTVKWVPWQTPAQARCQTQTLHERECESSTRTNPGVTDD